MKAIALLSAAMSAGLVSAGERIVNGQVVSADLYPFIVSLEMGDFHFCGGSLIRAEYPAIVLTAAHCFENNYTLYNNSFQDLSGMGMFAVLGRDDVQPPSDDDTYANVSIDMVKNHADYGHGDNDSVVNEWDIALIRLDMAVTGYEVADLYMDDTCCDDYENFTIMGYGADYYGGPATQTFERAFQQSVDISLCNRWLAYGFISNATNATQIMNMNLTSPAYDWLDQFQAVNDGNLCGFSYTQDTCQGDSGGPMIKTSTGQQVGVVSWGFGCASATPGVYTDVGYYYDWIMAAKACLVFDALDEYDHEMAMYCDMLCQYESIECTHYAMDLESTTGEPEEPPTTTGANNLDGGLDDDSMAASFASFAAIFAIAGIALQ